MRMDNRRLEALIGHEPRTPLNEAVRHTLLSLGCVMERPDGAPVVSA